MNDYDPGCQFGNETYHPLVNTTLPYSFGTSAISEEVFEVTVDGIIVGYVIRRENGRYASLTRNGFTLNPGDGAINYQLSVLRVVNDYRRGK